MRRKRAEIGGHFGFTEGIIHGHLGVQNSPALSRYKPRDNNLEAFFTCGWPVFEPISPVSFGCDLVPGGFFLLFLFFQKT